MFKDIFAVNKNNTTIFINCKGIVQLILVSEIHKPSIYETFTKSEKLFTNVQ